MTANQPLSSVVSRPERNLYAKEESQIIRILDTISNKSIFGVYDKTGNIVAENLNCGELVSFLSSRSNYDWIGGITDKDRKSIVRFGAAGHKNGFVDRTIIPGLLIKLKQKVQPNLNTALEFYLENENRFDERKSEQIVGVIKKWFKYGGNFYDHLTGKDLEMERGVDYKLNSDGSINMDNYKAARQEKIKRWLQETDNQAWLIAGKEFERSHRNQLSYARETILAQQLDGTFLPKERYTTSYFYADGWLYFESNYFDKQKGELKQPNRETTKYRVYFNVDGGDVLPVYQEIINLLSVDPDLQKLGFQIKTADISKADNKEIGQVMKQKDRIVLYLGEKGMEKALTLLQSYAEQNKRKFSRESVLLAQPLLDTDEQEISGISITSETKGYSPDCFQLVSEYKTFSDMQSMIIASSLRALITELKKSATFAAISKKYPTMKNNLESLLDNASEEKEGKYLQAILNDSNGESFLVRNLQLIYPQWSKAFGMSENNTAFKQKI